MGRSAHPFLRQLEWSERRESVPVAACRNAFSSSQRRSNQTPFGSRFCVEVRLALHLQRRLSTLQCKQPFFAPESTGVPAKPPTRFHHTMTRNDDCNRVVSVRRADGSRCLLIAQRSRDLEIGTRFTERNVEQCSPHRLLEIRASQIERNTELLPRTCKVLLEFLLRPLRSGIRSSRDRRSNARRLSIEKGVKPIHLHESHAGQAMRSPNGAHSAKRRVEVAKRKFHSPSHPGLRTHERLLAPSPAVPGPQINCNPRDS